MNFEYKNLICIIFGIVIICLIFKKRNYQENFDNDNLNEVNSKETDTFERKCQSIYGNYHPNCRPTSRLKHVGYFKFNTIKYPLLDFNTGFDLRRYVMLKSKFVKLKKKYWNRGYYFRNPLYYNKNVPFSFIYYYKYRGFVINPQTNKKFFIFGKRINETYYKYVLFREKNGLLQYAYNIPYRTRLNEGDTVFIKNQISTFGPFTFNKN
jgi:hypothetical protein